jgi:hypothetical protein
MALVIGYGIKLNTIMENKSTPRVAASLSAGPLLAVQQTMKESL